MSATEVISEGAEGVILESVLEGYAEYYSADLSEKVIRGMTNNALKCKYNGCTLPIGYIIDDEQHFQHDPLTSPYILEAFKQYDEGSPMTEIRAWLNFRNISGSFFQGLVLYYEEEKQDGRNMTMILSDRTIRSLLDAGTLTISPIEPLQLQPASVDIRLGDTFSIVEDSAGGILEMDKPVSYKTIRTNRYLLLPGQFVLAATMEYIVLPDNLTAFVEGRSSLGRMGLFIQNAGWVDPGFRGEITLELYNANRCAIQLQTGRRIGQLVFAQMDASAEHPYAGKYNEQRGATGSRIHLDPDLYQSSGQ